MKRKTLAFMIALLFLVLCATWFVILAEANPTCKIIGHHEPDAETQSPTITMFSPKNGTEYKSNLNLSFAVNVGESETAYKTMIMEIYYEADWLPSPVYLFDLYSNEYMLIVGDYPSNYTGNMSLSEIPDGEHSITVFAVEYGLYGIDETPSWFHSFSIEASAVIQIDKLADSIDIVGIFTGVTEPTPTSPSPLPSEEPLGQDVFLGVAVTVTVLSVGLGLLVYLIKRK